VPLDTPEDIVGLIVFFIGVCYIVMVRLSGEQLTGLYLNLISIRLNNTFQGTLCMKSMKQRRMISLLQHSYHQQPADDNA